MLRVVPLALVLALVACGDDGEASAPTTSAAPAPTTTGEVLDDFTADDVDELCDELAGLADIDPDADPTAAQVDRLLAIAETAPDGLAGPLRAVAAYGEAVVDGEGDLEARRAAAVDGAVLLIAYGNEACGIDVPLFDSIAGV